MPRRNKLLLVLLGASIISAVLSALSSLPSNIRRCSTRKYTACGGRPLLFLSFFMGAFCSDSHSDRNQAHDLVKHFTTAFLLAILKQDPAAGAALRSDRVDFPGVEFISEGF